MWGGSYTQSGANLTVTNAGYNGDIAPGASQSFGFLANSSGSNAEPTSFTVNGNTCTVT
jgi:hypothetical protein